MYMYIHVYCMYMLCYMYMYNGLPSEHGHWHTLKVTTSSAAIYMYTILTAVESIMSRNDARLVLYST